MDTLALVPAVILLGIAAAARRQSGSWLAPAAFAPLFWSVAIAAPLVWAPRFYVWWGGTWAILGLILAFAFGALLGQQKRGDRNALPFRERREWSPIRLPTLRVLISLCSIAGLISTILLVEGIGHSFADLLSIDGWVTVARETTVARYAYGYSGPSVGRVLATGIYLGSLLGAILWRFGQTRTDRFLAASPLILALVCALLTTAKAYLLFAGIMFCAAAWAAWICERGYSADFGKRTIVVAISSGALLGVFFVGMQALRSGQDVSDLEYGSSRTESTVFGYMSAFTTWLEQKPQSELTMGRYTIGGVFELAGVPREQGLYLDTVATDASQDTNVYTAFRGLLSDFGESGATLVLVLFGLVSGVAYRRTCEGSLVHVPILTLSYSFILCSQTTSILNYNSLLFAFVSLIFIFLLSRPQSAVSVAIEERAA